MADETPTSDPTSTPTPIELDEPEGEWTTPGNVRKPRLAARPSFDLHAVCVHLPALPSATSAQLLDILPAFIRAAKLPAHTCADVSVHLRNRNRLAILKTHHIELASRLLSVESIVLAGRIYAVAPYLAAPTNSCRGVIHGIAPDATQEELLRDLDSYQADILLARRMGNTNSALITFAGMHVPFSVYYQRLEFRCRPHKPRTHHCTICLQYEHRTCACPGNQRLCPTCSTPISQPDEPHSCSPWCLHGQGHHTPFAEICPVRMQRDEACANAAKKQRLLHRQQWKSLNTSQPPVKPSSPSSIPKVRASSSLLPTHAQWGGQHPRLTQVSPTPVIQPAPSAQPKPAEYHTPAPVKQDSPLQKPVHQVRSPTTPAPAPTTSPSPCRVEQLELGLTELTSRVTALTSLVEMQQKRIEAQDQRTSNLETLISNLTQSLDNLNSTINKAFNDAPGPMEDKNHPFKRTHPIPAADRQLGRLSSSAQGHWLLQRAGIRPIDFPLYTPQRPLPSNLRCAPIPSNMTPHLHEGRRQARAHFHDPFPPDTVTCYVDAAYYQTHGSTACVTMPTPLGIPITSTAGPFSLPTSSLSLELAAIVHATHELTLLPPSPRYRICSDSMAAIRALRDNRLPDNLHDDLSDALSLLSPALVTVVWVPGHAGIIGNKLAHELAREINSRAPTIPWPCPPIADEAHFYKKTLKQHYKHLRHSLQTLPPPHPRLSTAQVRTLRAIQLNTLITPARLYLYRYRSDPSCPNCPSTYANVEHILFSCPAALQSPHYSNPPPPHWRVWLASAAFADQLAMVLLAEEYL
ncbi:hypothetical protein HPB49_017383 [Dermacentor silvarum]|uniref:Uncharacterized protein n=1 Tax=Dermacentor silvarum TaxID=543639 RepID=A0ACB8CAJ9_DERSI|nr:hypothetical protein HPB49_017383 [Dermacentor silvarum]